MQPVLQNSTPGLFSHEEGESVSFSCTADGIPLPSIVWTFNGTLLQTTLNPRLNLHQQLLPGEPFRTHIPQALRSTLTIGNLLHSDSGNYRCRGDNGAGQPAVLTPSFRLTVNRSERKDDFSCYHKNYYPLVIISNRMLPRFKEFELYSHAEFLWYPNELCTYSAILVSDIASLYRYKLLSPPQQQYLAIGIVFS